jgi:hypothetical protein
MFPDKAVLYLCAIEDEEYKQDKIECTFFQVQLWLLIASRG